MVCDGLPAASGGDLWWFAVIYGGLRWFVFLIVILIMTPPYSVIINVE